MEVLPIFMTLRGRRCLVVGGGGAAAAKARLLVKAHAEVTFIAPALEREAAELVGAGEAAHLPRAFRADDVAASALVYGATGEPAVDETVSAAARAAGVPVNVVDRPDLSDFVMPAIVDRGAVVVGVSTGGAAPVLARRVRAAVEAALPAGIGRLARFAERFRDAVRARLPDVPARRRFWEDFFESPAAEAVMRGEEEEASRSVLATINRSDARAPRGAVYIVGAGPGDPELLTLRAVRLLQRADVIVYDKLVGPEILDVARRDAERIYAGKAKNRHAMTQAEINALLVDLARDGRQVVRLKGGDPFVFGRGGEELEHLRRAGVPAEVVPGITAAVGCAAAAGIPLTHRNHASAVTFLSGHHKEGEPQPDWGRLAQPGQTLAVYMGLSTAGLVAERLIAHGLSPETPAALVEKGTQPDQRIVTGRLADLGRLAQQHALTGPALIVVGDVVGCAQVEAVPAPARAVAV